MPSLPRYVLPQRRTTTTELSKPMRNLLLAGDGDGVDLFPRFNGDEQFTLSELKAIWKLHGDKLTQEYVKQNPGRRPWAWWLFTGKEKYGERPIVEGLPHWIAIERRFGLLHTMDTFEIQEPEADFLHRVGEVDDAELERHKEWLRNDHRTIQHQRYAEWLQERERLLKSI